MPFVGNVQAGSYGRRVGVGNGFTDFDIAGRVPIRFGNFITRPRKNRIVAIFQGRAPSHIIEFFFGVFVARVKLMFAAEPIKFSF